MVNYVKSLNIPVICFPREIKNYKKFCDIVKPDAVSIDYNVDPKLIVKQIKIPIQGGLDPKILLSDKKTLKKEVLRMSSPIVENDRRPCSILLDTFSASHGPYNAKSEIGRKSTTIRKSCRIPSPILPYYDA